MGNNTFTLEYSMLKIEICLKYDVDVSKFSTIIAYLKKKYWTYSQKILCIQQKTH